LKRKERPDLYSALIGAMVYAVTQTLIKDIIVEHIPHGWLQTMTHRAFNPYSDWMIFTKQTEELA
jgi:hypothetical protein